jgi:hypothetical protein
MPTRKDADGRWHAEACVGRRRLHRRLPVGASAGDAKRIEAELIRALHTQRATKTPNIPGDPPLVELMADYTERHAKNLRSPDTAQYHGYRIGRWLEGKRASETREVAAAIVQDLTGVYAPAAIGSGVLMPVRTACTVEWTMFTCSDRPEFPERKVTLWLPPNKCPGFDALKSFAPIGFDGDVLCRSRGVLMATGFGPRWGRIKS